MDVGFTLGFIAVCLLVAFVALAFVRNQDEQAKAKGDAYYNAYKEQINENLKKQEYGKGYGIKCPNCGQVNVKKISTTSRAVSVGLTGLASDKIGKTYKCPKCNYIW